MRGRSLEAACGMRLQEGASMARTQWREREKARTAEANRTTVENIGQGRRPNNGGKLIPSARALGARSGNVEIALGALLG